MTNDERMQRESSLIATIRRKLPDVRQHTIMEQLPFLTGRSSRSLGGLKSHINAGCKQLDCAPVLSKGSGSGDRRLHEINRDLRELRGVVIEVSRQFEIPWELFS
jgi:hypothetical protein